MVPSFPGGISPRLEDRLQPEKIPSMIDALHAELAALELEIATAPSSAA
jgi:hypothetical protein